MIVRLLLWSLADSKTTIDELRTHLPESENRTWVSDEVTDRFGVIETWDGAKWNIAPEWYEADEQIIKPMVKTAANKYADEKKLTRRTPEDCQT